MGGREKRGCVTNWPAPSTTSLGSFGLWLLFGVGDISFVTGW